MLELTKAIKTRFTAASLNATITGGLYQGGAPIGATMPYAVFIILNAPRSASFSTEPYTAHVQFTVIGDGANAVGVLAEALVAAYNVTLTLDPTSKKNTHTRVLTEPFGMKQPEGDPMKDSSVNDVWGYHCEVEYVVQ